MRHFRSPRTDCGPLMDSLLTMPAYYADQGLRVYETVERPSVRLSRRSTAVAMCGGFAAGRRSEGSIGSGERRRPAATAAFSGKCGQCHVDSRVSKQVSNKCIAVRKVATPLRELTCHMGSHSVTCHPAEVTFPPLPQPKLVLD